MDRNSGQENGAGQDQSPERKSDRIVVIPMLEDIVASNPITGSPKKKSPNIRGKLNSGSSRKRLPISRKRMTDYPGNKSILKLRIVARTTR